MSETGNNQSGIEIYDYDGNWRKTFLLIEEVLKNTLGNLLLRVEHVGSTSVRGLAAKPIVDIDDEMVLYPMLRKVLKQ
ncbi:GrpB family protein [Robertmurraya korlensis]|uniref:GrpB family protein n=1 Tax=Robertmurraya korlensis TaxID=519977 RepID=UPI000825D854|nr:GrpB family protein [Robertmurraya korlensis]